MSDAPPKHSGPGVAELFTGFFGIGVIGFGGVLPWARRMVVEQRGWLDAAEFTDMLALCQFLPGPNVANVAVALGSRFRGVPGAVAALTGLLAAPVAIVIGLGAIYGRFGQQKVVAHLFAGLAAAASGLILSMAIRIAAPLRSRLVEAAIATLTFVAVAMLRLPLLPTMLVLAPLSTLVAWHSGRRGKGREAGPS